MLILFIHAILQTIIESHLKSFNNKQEIKTLDFMGLFGKATYTNSFDFCKVL